MEYDLAIIGLGPGGLAAALRAAKDGKKVVAFTDREQYVRQQRMIINHETVIFLKEFKDENDPDDRKFFEKMASEAYDQGRYLVQTKDIEGYLYRKLEQFSKQNPESIKIVKADKKAQTPFIEAIGKRVTGDHFIETASRERFAFKHLLAADGAKHRTASIVERDLGSEAQEIIGRKDKKIIYKSMPHQERSKYQATVQLRLKPGITPPKMEFDDVDLSSRMNAFRELGWRETYPPKGYAFSNSKKTKFSFAGEIPEEIFKIQDEAQKKEALKKWASCHIEAHYGISPDSLEFKLSTKKIEKNKLQAAAFEMELVTSDKPLVELSDSSVFAQVGDARRTPNFYMAHGLNDAIAGGIAFSNSIDASGKFDQGNYLKVIMEMDKKFDSRMKGIATTWQTQALDSLVDRIQFLFSEECFEMTLLDAQKRAIPKISSSNDYMSIKDALINILLKQLATLCRDHAIYLQNIKDKPSRKTMGLPLDEKLHATQQLSLIINGDINTKPVSEIFNDFQKAVHQNKDIFNDNTKMAQEKSFFSKILHACGDAESSLNHFKKAYRANLPSNYELTDDARASLSEKLQRYIKVREQEGQGTFLGRGYSKEEKLDAAKALIMALDNKNTQYVDLAMHKSALRNGELGSMIRDHIKSISGNNTVSGLLEDLMSKMPEPTLRGMSN